MANSTQLRAEYAERSWDYELPDHLEQALEDDYVQNSHLYSEKTFKYIHMRYALHTGVTSEKLLKLVRECAEIS